MPSRIRIRTIIAGVILLAGFLVWAGTAGASPNPIPDPLPTWRSAPPPTVYPPSQSDNGAQLYWGMCQDCHGDQEQGLTAEWRSAFAPDYQDCWEAGCHGEDRAPNSFLIPATGAPALAGPGALSQYPTAFELGDFIYHNMPLHPPGSLSEDQAWELTAFLLARNQAGSPEIILKDTNSAAVPVHQPLSLPENPLPWALLGSVLLGVGAAGYRRLSAATTSSSPRGNFFQHLHPATIPAKQSRLGYTLGAGGLAAFLCLVLLVTGILETYYYQPSPESAAASIQTLAAVIPFGQIVRNLHFWSAQLLVIVLMIHLVRVILTGAYAPPRRFNYLLGLSLLVAALLLDFTGYLLRWDEGIRWALVVGTNLLKTIPGIGNALYRFVIGGAEPGPASLIRFYSWHIFGLTLVFTAIAVWHIFRIRRDGGVSAPPVPHREVQERISRAKLVRREVLAMLVAGSALLLVSALVPAPIDQPLTGTGSLAGDSGAPWFFLWIQETLKIGDPFLWGVAAPLLAVIILGLLPYLLPNARQEQLGRWLPAGSRAAQIIGMVIIAVIFLLTLTGWLS
jgi:quinol-cytochrome oxidoreductase complex cytochrome b subunit/mono/diheme cytochrome c family protein